MNPNPNTCGSNNQTPGPYSDHGYCRSRTRLPAGIQGASTAGTRLEHAASFQSSRSLQDWKVTFSRVDGHLQVKDIEQSAGSVLSVIELGLEVEPASTADGARVQLWSTVG